MKTKIAMSVGLGLLTFNATASNLVKAGQAKSLAMGGVGIAVTDITSAVTHNPAVLSSGKIKDGWFLSLPTITVGASDEDDFIDALDEFQDTNSIDELELAIDSAGLPGSYSYAADVAQRLSGELAQLSDRRIEADLGALLSLAVPGQTLGFALKATVGASLGGEIQYRDADTINDLTSELNAYEECYAANALVPGSCIPDSLTMNYVDLETGVVNFDVDEDLKSQVLAQGVVVGEVGLAFTHMHKFGETPVSFSVMPKMQHISVFHYNDTVENADLDDASEDEYISDDTFFNADLGLLVEVNEYVNFGVTLTNILSQEIETVTPITEGGEVVELSPQLRAGVAFEYGWLTFAIDADLTKNKVPFSADEQIIAMGAELDAWDVAKLRVGYQQDLESSDSDLVSAGLGLNLLGLTLDVGAAANDHKAIASMQLGFKW
ncbi:conjugal transfer protein TraF [Thalassotalea maritima]|uniref:conjugal transfer protein TraF n=1 Tax=Thalassotalea maritima TaxID=3242416 RepID=UPI003527BA65